MDELTALFGPTDQGFVAEFDKLLPRPVQPVSPFGDVDRKFIIGFTARVGSTLLCQHLFRYGVAVAEFFNPVHITRGTYIAGATDYRNLCARLVETYAVNRAWGVKAHVQSTIPLFLVGEFPDNIPSWRFVYLTRDNILRQAISMIVAAKTQKWASWSAAGPEVLERDYSCAEINQAIKNIQRSQQSWEKFFTFFGLRPLRLTYEEIDADPVAAARLVAEYCGLEAGGEELVKPFRQPPLVRQSTSLNSAWERRFREECSPKDQGSGGRTTGPMTIERDEYERLKQIIERSGRFDADFYERTYRELIPAGQLPLDHFLAVGHSQGLLASAHFDPIVYKLRHPDRSDPNPLVDCAINGGEAEYRDIAALFPDSYTDSAPITIRYRAGLEAAWAKNVQLIGENVARSASLPWGDSRYELRNPAPEIILSRIAENRAFSLVRLGHGFWDAYCAMLRLARKLRGDPRCRSLTRREAENAAMRLLARKHLPGGIFIAYVESILQEIEDDLLGNPLDETLWTAVSLKGVPTFDDGLFGYNVEDVRDRMRVLARFFGPDDELYDAMLWKRWALSGDLARLPEAIRGHPVILIGPQKFHSLGIKWRLESYTHIAVAPNFSHLVRHSILDRAAAAIGTARLRSPDARPIVLSQCGDALAYWLIRRLRVRFPDVFFLDLGQALDIWYLDPAIVWIRIYRDALVADNPFAAVTTGQAEPEAEEKPGPGSGALGDKVMDILRSDYLETGLMAIPPTRPVCDLAGGFRGQGAMGWTARLPAEFEALTDNSDTPHRSPLVLLEDGKALGMGHDLHTAIETAGGGRYSFWQAHIYFSTSDGSDPNANGRTYSIARIDVADPHRPFGAPAIERSDAGVPPLPIPQTLENRFDPNGLNGWLAYLPREFEALTDNDGAPHRSPLVLLEDGRELGPRHALHDAIRQLGGGRYSFWKGQLYFSTLDNSDPNRNGRTYSVVRRVPSEDDVGAEAAGRSV